VACCRGDVFSSEADSSLKTYRSSFVLDVEVGTQKQLAATGWERDAAGKHRPRRAELKALTDPAELATSAAKLNLHLMRWRLLPSLDVDTLGATKCLLLGAGTLGCNVARNLVGWGVRHVTFVDNSAVSYSNPARQSLFTVKDVGRRKAEAAAAALSEIAPGTASVPSRFTGVDLTIPMPGHALLDESAVETLAALVDSHDVLFVLTDTREARWLPTLLASASRSEPTVINVGLGLDSFVVVRHGAGSDLGCYFCNDVVAPGDSTKDRTLDQQCTVSRPGLAPLASALAVELAVALLHHPKRHRAPADNAQDRRSGSNDQPLGMLPHSIRGFLTHYSTLAITTRHFDRCSACSTAVLNPYRANRLDFVRQVCADPAVLERVSGLADLSADVGDLDDFVLDDDDDATAATA